MKSVKVPFPVFLWIARVLGAIAFFAAIFAPFTKDEVLAFNLIRAIALLFYAYSLLSADGYFKTIAAIEEDGTIVYDTSIAMIPIALCRIVEIALEYLIFKNDLNLYGVGCILLIDVLFVTALLLDKSSFCYESGDVEER